MQRWLDIILKSFPFLKDECSNIDNASFSILDSVDEKTLKVEKASEKGICFSWSDNENSFLAAVIEEEGCTADEIQDKLEVIFDRLFENTSSELYAARNVIIDDMYGLEVLGGNQINDTLYDVFYGLYLAGQEKSYVIIGFGNDEVESVFEKLTGLARLFSRKPYPALINKGKSEDKEITCVRILSQNLQPDYELEYQILNCTFYIKDGKLDKKNETSYLLLSKAGIREMEYDELYKGDKDIEGHIVSLLQCISAYDISGFTITLFKDGRYGITYYPYEDDIEDEEHDHSHNESCSHEHYYNDEDNDYFPTKGSEKEYALSYMNNLHSKILSPVPAWDKGMVLIQNTENFTMVYPYYSKDEKPYIEINIVENLSDDVSDESYMEELGTEYGKYYPAMYDFFGERVDDENLYTVLFSFKNNGQNGVDEKSLVYKEFSFAYFTSVEELDESITAVCLLNTADELENIFVTKPYCFICIEVEYKDNNASLQKVSGSLYDLKEEVIDAGLVSHKVFNELNNIFKENSYKGSFLKLIIFPNGKIGIVK